MEFRSQKAARALVAALVGWLAPAALNAQPFQYEARHDHLRKSGAGTLVIDEQGVSFTEVNRKQKPPKHPHVWKWAYRDIQQLEVAPGVLRILTYQDNKWKLGADREYRFTLASGQTFNDAYEFLKNKLDQRFVAALPDKDVQPAWEVPVKHLLRFGGSQGVLAFGEERVVYTADRKDDSRTWRYSDIENITSTGPYALTITTYERALAHYGSLKGFNFQLKEKLDETRYNELWRRVNRGKGLRVLDAYRAN